MSRKKDVRRRRMVLEWGGDGELRIKYSADYKRVEGKIKALSGSSHRFRERAYSLYVTSSALYSRADISGEASYYTAGKEFEDAADGLMKYEEVSQPLEEARELAEKWRDEAIKYNGLITMEWVLPWEGEK